MWAGFYCLYNSNVLFWSIILYHILKHRLRISLFNIKVLMPEKFYSPILYLCHEFWFRLTLVTLLHIFNETFHPINAMFILFLNLFGPPFFSFLFFLSPCLETYLVCSFFFFLLLFKWKIVFFCWIVICIDATFNVEIFKFTKALSFQAGNPVHSGL